MAVVANLIKIKVDQIEALQSKLDMQREVIHTIDLAGAICTQRSQNDLVRSIKQYLPPFFGFETASVLLRDVKTDFLFTLNELSKDETEQILRKMHREEKRTEKEKLMEQADLEGIEYKPVEEDTWQEDSKERAYIDEFIQNFRETKRINFPNNRGVSGRAFQKNVTVYSNEMHRVTDYAADVDNVAQV